MKKNNKVVMEFAGISKVNIYVEGEVKIRFNEEVEIRKVTRSGGWDYIITDKEGNEARVPDMETLKAVVEDIDYFNNKSQVFYLSGHQDLEESNIDAIIDIIERGDVENHKKIVLNYLKQLREDAPVLKQILEDYEYQKTDIAKRFHRSNY